MIRKQVLGNMTDLLKAHFENHNSLVDYWVLAVVPCLHDPETKIQELVQEVRKIIFICTKYIYYFFSMSMTLFSATLLSIPLLSMAHSCCRGGF
jgi:hypothetical protein